MVVGVVSGVIADQSDVGGDGGNGDTVFEGVIFAGLGGLAGMAVGAIVGSVIQADSWEEVHLPVGDPIPNQPLFLTGTRVRLRLAEPAIFVDLISGAELSVFPENEEVVTGTLESIRDDSLFIHRDDFATAVPVLAWVGWWGWESAWCRRNNGRKFRSPRSIPCSGLLRKVASASASQSRSRDSLEKEGGAQRRALPE